MDLDIHPPAITIPTPSACAIEPELPAPAPEIGTKEGQIVPANPTLPLDGLTVEGECYSQRFAPNSLTTCMPQTSGLLIALKRKSKGQWWRL